LRLGQEDDDAFTQGIGFT